MVGRSKRLQSTLPHTSVAPLPDLAPCAVAAAGALRRRIAEDGSTWRAVLLRLLRNVAAEFGAVASFAAVVLYDLLGAHAGEDVCRRGMLSGDRGLAEVVGGLLDGCVHDVKGILKYCLAALVLLLRDEAEGVRANTGLAGRVSVVLGRLVEGVATLQGEVQCLVVEAVHWAAACVPGVEPPVRGSSLCADAQALLEQH